MEQNNVSISERIEQHFQQLSKGQKKVAQFILKNPSFAIVNSATCVGEKAGTSETTVIRFCYAIGLTGYAQLQKELTMNLVEHSNSSSLGKYFATKEALLHEERPVAEMMMQVSKQIIEIGEQIDESQIEHIAKELHEARNIYLVGSGASSFAVQWLHFTLSILRPNVHLLFANSSTMYRSLKEVSGDSLVMTVSLHRYVKESIMLTQILKEQGAYTVAITDSRVAPIANVADELFVLQQTELSTIDMMPSLIAFLNTLVAVMVGQNLEFYNEQRAQFDAMQNRYLADRWS